ncbi:coiled-coil domain-containing protein 22 homolog isoform X2 [Jatropha curcas]|uniref:coiled-coil domain-containing protein 22 homolog isoform X2 n=1 Tax=Jatropha curcas TaxID=180498 RepID=UPI0005FB6DFA|nr:coiled-coil domain-containing protein 22 homolog isoform X2 [Jatropha curcas]
MSCLRQLLYPSEEDLYKLVRFLVERLSESSNVVKIPHLNNVKATNKINENNSMGNLEDWIEKTDSKGFDLDHPQEKLEDLSLSNVLSESSESKVEDASFGGSIPQNVIEDKLPGKVNGSFLAAEEDESGRNTFGSEETLDQKDDKHVQKVTPSEDHLCETRHETEMLQDQERVLLKEVTARTSELQKLEEEFKMLKAAAHLAFDDQYPIDFHLEQLSKHVDSRKCNIMELESEWDAFRKPLEEKKRSLEESLYADIPEAQKKLQKLREVELEKQLILSEIRRREEEQSKLSEDLDKQPRQSTRTSYIERIKEITKNSRKQDADIERILKETRDLQLESNSIQERLHRTYAVLDEIVFREAKKDPVGRQAYRLLTSIHECFEQISEKILMADRVQREVAGYEKKLTSVTSRSLNVDKLQADLDAIIKENEHLAHRQNN